LSTSQKYSRAFLSQTSIDANYKLLQHRPGSTQT
jgi:hypothetical protein